MERVAAPSFEAGQVTKTTLTGSRHPDPPFMRSESVSRSYGKIDPANQVPALTQPFPLPPQP